jgi:tRNA (guanine37-N1)-methyltransferase
MQVPEVLIQGDHAKIQQWQLAESLRRTQERRQDLLANPPSASPDSNVAPGTANPA